MSDIIVKDLAGNEVDTISLSEQVFAAKINIGLMHQAVVRLQSDRRQGTHKAKTRSEVRGGGAKPWRQKGTGRARQGTKTSPLWRGGGVAFPPVPRKYDLRMPKKMRRQATRSALSSRISDNGIIVVSSLVPEDPHTRAMVSALEKLGARGKILLVDQHVDSQTVRSTRNIPEVECVPASTLNIVEVLKNDVLIFSIDGIRQIERLLTHGDA
jgi:large subunit ribosomal protein L4